MTKNLRLSAKSVNTSWTYEKSVDVEIDDAVISDVLDNFSIDEILEHFGKDELLDKIGEDHVKEYFGLIEESDAK